MRFRDESFVSSLSNLDGERGKPKEMERRERENERDEMSMCPMFFLLHMLYHHIISFCNDFK